MTRAARSLGRRLAPWALVVAMSALAVGTISNQFRINAANTQLKTQAANGQKALVRQCKLVGVSQKMYADALRRGVIESADFTLFVLTAQQACTK